MAKTTDVKLLMEAMKKLGYTVRETATGFSFAGKGHSGTYQKASGKFSSTGSYSTLDIGEVKRGYSEEVVTSQAKRNGWQISWSTNKEGRREAKVLKRG